MDLKFALFFCKLRTSHIINVFGHPNGDWPDIYNTITEVFPTAEEQLETDILDEGKNEWEM